MLPLAHYGHAKPRLDAQRARSRLQRILSSNQLCLQITRLTCAELTRLADMLGCDDERATGNWRFTSLHRLVIALYCFSERQCLRRARESWGWAMNSISSNMEEMCDLIIDKLDAPGSRMCSSLQLSATAALSVRSHLCLSV
jgi:hypothetical protein